MSEPPAPVLVRAKHGFKGANNDELVFDKGDVITVTQQLDGGWWEGTLGERTAWFPCNYVSVLDPKELLLRSSPAVSIGLPGLPSNSNRTQYRAQVLKDFLDKESAHVAKLRGLLGNLLQPMRAERSLGGGPLGRLAAQLEDVVREQSSLLEALGAETQRGSVEQRVGGAMLARALELGALQRTYAGAHPMAVAAVQQHRPTVESVLQTRASSMAELIGLLSLPFRHLTTYPTTLQELERNMEESQPDRGDTQRAIEVYRKVVETCEAARKAGETELDLLETGVEGLEGGAEDLRRLSPLLLVAQSVQAVDEGVSLGSRTALLFHASTIFLLQRSADFQSYVFKEGFNLQDASISRVHNKLKELVVKTAESELGLSLLFSSQDEAGRWLETMGRMEGVRLDESCSGFASSSATTSPSRDAGSSVASHSPASAAASKAATLPAHFSSRLNHQLGMIDPEPADNRHEPYTMSSSLLQSAGSGSLASGPGQAEGGGARVPPPRLYSRHCLLPHPAPRGKAGTEPGKTLVRLRAKAAEAADEEDAAVLRVVEAFCSAAGKGTAAKAQPTQAQIILAEDEKLFVEEVVDGEVRMEEKSLVDTVYAHQHTIQELQEQMGELRRALEREVRARRRLEASRTPNDAPAPSLSPIPPVH